MKRFAGIGALVFGTTIAGGCGVDNAVVDGRCRAGFAPANGRCVAVVPPYEPTAPGDAVDASSGPDVAQPGPRTPYTPPSGGHDAGTSNVDADSGGSGDAGAPPVACSGALAACGDTCVSTASDAKNCGACGKICRSNICVAGECIGAVAGDVIVFGQDFRGALTNSVQAQALANAVLIATAEPIRVLSFEAGADSDAVGTTNALAAQGARSRRRDLVFTHTVDPSALEAATLSRDHDVILVHGVPNGEAATTGARWAAPLDQFARDGGVIIVFDGGAKAIPILLTESGLLPLSNHTVLPAGTALNVAVPGDAIGTKLLSPHVALGGVVSFQGVPAPSNDITWVIRAEVEDGLGDPVIIHRTVR